MGPTTDGGYGPGPDLGSMGAGKEDNSGHYDGSNRSPTRAAFRLASSSTSSRPSTRLQRDAEGWKEDHRDGVD